MINNLSAVLLVGPLVIRNRPITNADTQPLTNPYNYLLMYKTKEKHDNKFNFMWFG